jgi:predicted cobalt transporter CbtA
MPTTHRDYVEELLASAAADHARLITQLPEELRASLPVDAQGVTRAIEHLAAAAGLSDEQRLALIRPHAVNPAVLHARVFGSAPLARETVIASFVEGARVRAAALTALADAVGGEPLVLEVRTVLAADPPPVRADAPDVLPALRATYAAHERAAIMIADGLDRLAV